MLVHHAGVEVEGHHLSDRSITLTGKGAEILVGEDVMQRLSSSTRACRAACAGPCRMIKRLPNACSCWSRSARAFSRKGAPPGASLIHQLGFDDEEGDQLVCALAGCLQRLVVVQADVASDPPDMGLYHPSTSLFPVIISDVDSFLWF
jgi:hypothetical protein